MAEIYQQKAVDKKMGWDTYQDQRKAIIETCKKEGRQADIQKELQQLKEAKENSQLSILPELCYIEGQDLEDYLHDVKICQAFAKRNRERMAELIVEKMEITPIEAFHTIHNYIDTEEKIVRKGAISAKDGKTVLIPINMRDGSILAKGRGNPDWNYSAPHGAGRLMSRNQARQSLSLDQYKKAMEGIYTTSVNDLTLDEAPMAYKSIDAILDSISDSVDLLEVLIPKYNFKVAD